MNVFEVEQLRSFCFLAIVDKLISLQDAYIDMLIYSEARPRKVRELSCLTVRFLTVFMFFTFYSMNAAVWCSDSY